MLQTHLHDWLRATTLDNDERIATLVRPLDPGQLVRRPTPAGWSAGEVLEHLCVSDEIYDDPFREATSRARPDPAAPLRAWKPTWLGNFIARTLENPRRVKAPKPFRIGPTPRDGVVEAFLAREKEFVRTIDASASLDWQRVKLASPALPSFLKFNLGDAFRIHVVHVSRHAKQIERVLAGRT
jgi:DinB superfamily